MANPTVLRSLLSTDGWKNAAAPHDRKKGETKLVGAGQMLLMIYLYAFSDSIANEKPPPLGVFQIWQRRLTDCDDTEFELSTVNST